jgi:predicted transcriptional regulator
MQLDQVTDVELSILQFLWEREEASTREITLFLYNEISGSKMSSAQKFIERLENKGCIERRRIKKRIHRFRALATQEQYIQARLQVLADRVCDGTLVPLATSLVRSKGLTKKEREQLRKLISEL